MFSANSRLPSSMLQKDKRQRVEDTLQELGLTSCADTKVKSFSAIVNIKTIMNFIMSGYLSHHPESVIVDFRTQFSLLSKNNTLINPLMLDSRND